VRVELLRALRRARVREEVFRGERLSVATLRLLRLEAGPFSSGRPGLGPADAAYARRCSISSTALEFSGRPGDFLCYDARARQLRPGEHGLTVLAPGVDEVHEP
jgi:hypothetical protein